MPRTEQRLALIGAGWISGYHLAALDRLGRTRLVAVASGSLASAGAVALSRGVPGYAIDQLDVMLDTERPEVAFVAVPPAGAVGILERLVERGIPFLTEKPLAALDAAGPARVAAAVEATGLVTAVGYHLRGLEAMTEVRERLAAQPALLMTARWLGDTPPQAWWRAAATGGGQVIEQATHFYDLARWLVGEAHVVAAASTQAQPFALPGVELVDSTAALLEFDSGAIGSFANSRRLAAAAVAEVELVCPDLLITIRKLPQAQTTWEVVFNDGRSSRTIPPGRDPYEVQAEAFLDAVEQGNPAQVLSTYPDALQTDRLTRAVVAATGRSG
jgi:predicted dehydrogenase